jgi:uncharacterized delta-60 repeat protein
MKYRTGLIFAAFSIFLFTFPSFGQTANVDPDFSPFPSVSAMLTGGYAELQPDGRIIFLAIYGPSEDPVSNVYRLNQDGSLDSSFICGSCDFNIGSIKTQQDGKVLIGGYNPSTAAPRLVRLNSDGSLDPSFVSPFNQTGATWTAAPLGVDAAGNIFASLRFAMAGGSSMTLYRLQPNGTIDTAFTPLPFDTRVTQQHGIAKLTVLADGKIIIAGRHDYGEIFRVNTDGTKDFGFPTPVLTLQAGGTAPFINGYVQQPDGKIAFAGRFDTVNGFNRPSFARLNSNGSFDPGFAPQPPFITGTGGGSDIQAQSTGKMIISGTFLTSRFRRIELDGSIDNTFQTPNVTTLNSWNVDANDRILFFGEYSGGPRGLYRLNPDGSLDSTFHVNIRVPATVKLAVPHQGGKVLIAGAFQYVGNMPRAYFGRLLSDGTLDSTFIPATGFNSSINQLLVQPDGRIIALDVSGTRLARINADGSLDTTFALSISGVNTIALQSDGKIILGGGNIAVNGFSRSGLARVNPDGTLDTPFNPGVTSPNVMTVFVQANGKIIFGGTFTGVGGLTRQNLARLNSDGTGDATFNAGNIATVRKVVQETDGKYLAATNTVLRLNSDGSIDLSFQSPTISNGIINDILVEPSGAVIAGGSFTAPRSRIARFRSSGDLDAGFLPIGADGDVLNLNRQQDGKVLVAGAFTSIGGYGRAGIARLLPTATRGITSFDFDGDGRADISVTRPGSAYVWYQLLGPSYTFSQTTFGQASDIVTPADFDGDGITDLAIFRNGDWWYRSSVTGQQLSAHWGAEGDIPLPGDIDGDGRADFVVYRNGTWYRLINGQATQLNMAFGAAGDKPLLADFDGDGRADPAIFRPSTGTFWYAASSAGGAHRGVQWGISTDVPVPADYDGDGATDFAVYRASQGAWYILNSSNGSFVALQFGIAEDRPIPADFDGDGNADVAVYRPSTGIWYLLQSTSGFGAFQWGVSTDVPSPAAYVPE